MSLKTTILYTKQPSVSKNFPATGQDGFRVVLTVNEATNIDKKIFVLHREVLTSAEENAWSDTFYTVASISDMEDIPDAPQDMEGFYRVDSIDLIFRSKQDFDAGLKKIETMIGRLVAANDRVINLEPTPEIVGIPESAVWRYWGQSVATSLTDEEIQDLLHEPAPTADFSKEFTTDGPRYLYVAYRAELDVKSFTLNGTPVDMTVTTRDFVNEDGHQHSYLIYRTTSTQNGTSMVLATV